MIRTLVPLAQGTGKCNCPSTRRDLHFRPGDGQRTGRKEGGMGLTGAEGGEERGGTDLGPVEERPCQLP